MQSADPPAPVPAPAAPDAGALDAAIAHAVAEALGLGDAGTPLPEGALVVHDGQAEADVLDLWPRLVELVDLSPGERATIEAWVDEVREELRAASAAPAAPGLFGTLGRVFGGTGRPPVAPRRTALETVEALLAQFPADRRPFELARVQAPRAAVVLGSPPRARTPIPMLLPPTPSRSFRRMEERLARQPATLVPPPPALRRRGSRPPSAPPRQSPVPAPAPVSLETLRRICGHGLVPLDGLRRWGELPGRPFLALEVTGDDAFDRWLAFRNLAASTGYRPCLLGGEGGPPDFAAWFEGVDPAAIDADLEVGARLDLEHLLEARGAHVPIDDEPGRTSHLEALAPLRAPTLVHPPLDPTPHRRMGLVLVPARLPWELAAVLRFGGRGTFAPPAGQVAFHAAWHARFGAEPLGIAGEKIEMYVAAPPRTADAALALAREHVAYCPALLDAHASVRALARVLEGAPIWSFAG